MSYSSMQQRSSEVSVQQVAETHDGRWPGAAVVKRLHGTGTSRILLRAIYKQGVLLSFTVCLLLSSLLLFRQQSSVLAADPGAGNACNSYTIRYGDTLNAIAARNHTYIGLLARVNHIANVNLIFAGNRLCLPYKVASGETSYGQQNVWSGGGLYSNHVVVWYAWGALQWSSPSQVTGLLRQAAAQYGLPASLLLAIAWQESGWTQHVISRDGGIGVMQIMPYTAQDINASTRMLRNPYHVWDNITMGAIYLSWLWRSFGGNLSKVISAYNEGGWAVAHRGIFNWSYVNNVLYLMRVYR